MKTMLRMLSVLLITISSYNYGKGYTNYIEADQARNNALISAFYVNNLIMDTTPDGLQKWRDFIENMTSYLNTILAKERGLGMKISASNKKLLEEARNALTKIGKELGDIIAQGKTSLYESRTHEAIIKTLEKIGTQIKSMLPQIENIHTFGKTPETGSLRKGTADNNDTRDTKKLFQNTAATIREVYKKLIEDFNKKVDQYIKEWKDPTLKSNLNNVKVSITLFN